MINNLRERGREKTIQTEGSVSTDDHTPPHDSAATRPPSLPLLLPNLKKKRYRGGHNLHNGASVGEELIIMLIAVGNYRVRIFVSEFLRNNTHSFFTGASQQNPSVFFI